MDTLTIQDNGKSMSETTTLGRESPHKLVNTNEMLLNLKIAKNNNLDESTFDNNDSKVASGSESSGSTLSAPEIEPYRHNEGKVVHFGGGDGDSVNTTPTVNNNEDFFLSPNLIQMTSPLGKLRHYKKELMYNSFLRSNASETITREEDVEKANSSLKEAIENSLKANLKQHVTTHKSNIQETDQSMENSGLTRSREKLKSDQVNLSNQAELLSKLKERELVRSPNPSEASESVVEACDESMLMTSSNSSPTFSPPSTEYEMPHVATHVGRKPLNGPPCSLKILVDDQILEPMNGVLSYDIMGSHFLGDLLPNGFIRMMGTNQVFANPSSWTSACRSTIPACNQKDAKQFGSAWSIIRYQGKRLDSYKLRWYRKQKKVYSSNGSSGNLTGNLSTSSYPPTSSSSSPNFFGNNNSHSFTQHNNTNSGSGLGSYQSFTGHSMSNFSPPNMFSTPNNKSKGKHSNGMMSNMYDTFPNTSTPVGHGRGGGRHDTQNWGCLVPRDGFFKIDKASGGDWKINTPEVKAASKAVEFESININNPPKDTRVRCVPFGEVGCMQPFLVTVSTNVLLLVDFHSHLLNKKVVGYLAGTWNPRTQLISVCQAFPCKAKDAKEKRKFEVEVKKFLSTNNMILVGWYHSHPTSDPHPTIEDIKHQIEFEKTMFENRNGLISYSPCIGLIASPRFNRKFKLEATMNVNGHKEKKVELKAEAKENEVEATENKHKTAEDIDKIENNIMKEEQVQKQVQNGINTQKITDMETCLEFGEKNKEEKENTDKVDDVPEVEESPDKLDEVVKKMEEMVQKIEEIKDKPNSIKDEIKAPIKEEDKSSEMETEINSTKDNIAFFKVPEAKKENKQGENKSTKETTKECANEKTRTKQENGKTEVKTDDTVELMEQDSLKENNENKETKENFTEIKVNAKVSCNDEAKEQIVDNKEDKMEDEDIIEIIPGAPILAPNEPRRNYQSLFQMFWVLPMMTSSPTVDIGRPMQLCYTVVQNDFLTQELLIDMKTLAIHYYGNPYFVDFTQSFEDPRLGTEWDKLKTSLRQKLPRDLIELNTADTMQQQALSHFWRFLHQLLVVRRGTTL